MIISYAQNFEDVMLWRALKHVDSGFYIDVGANDPNIESVTRLFYEHGWSGINIEPVEQWFNKLKQVRTKDVNLRVAVGADSGEIILYEVQGTGLSTIDKATAERHERDKGYKKNAFRVELKSLTEICESYCRSEIHFLKIDVERAELQVIQGMDFDKFRPWIVLVEATLPNLPTEDYEAWEPLVVESGYRMVYWDGLNRFYVAEEKYEELIGSFQSPPNVFDEFVLADVVHARLDAERADRSAAVESEKVAVLSRELENTEERLKNTVEELNSEREMAQQFRESANLFQLMDARKSAEIQALRNSLSWRITSPLRWLARPMMNGGKSERSIRRKPIESTMIWAMGNPALVKGVHLVVDRCPPLRRAITTRIASILNVSDDLNSLGEKMVESGIQLSNESFLTPHAKRIQQDIKAEIDRISGSNR